MSHMQHDGDAPVTSLFLPGQTPLKIGEFNKLTEIWKASGFRGKRWGFPHPWKAVQVKMSAGLAMENPSRDHCPKRHIEGFRRRW